MSPQLLDNEPMDGKYRLGGAVCQSGVGVVYGAEHLPSGAHCTISLLPWTKQLDQQQRLQCQRDLRAAQGIASPNLARVQDLGQTADGIVYVVMEPLEGQSLARRLERGTPMGLAPAVALLTQVAAGLAAVHLRGFIHGGLCPASVLLCPTGRGDEQVKVLDLGCAWLLHGQPDVAELESVLRYQAPGTSDPGELGDPRADVYAAGALLWEMLTGRRPPSKPALVAQAVDREVLAIARGALATDPADRFPSMAALSKALLGAAGRAGRDSGEDGWRAPRVKTEVLPADDAEAVDSAPTEELGGTIADLEMSVDTEVELDTAGHAYADLEPDTEVKLKSVTGEETGSAAGVEAATGVERVTEVMLDRELELEEAATSVELQAAPTDPDPTRVRDRGTRTEVYGRPLRADPLDEGDREEGTEQYREPATVPAVAAVEPLVEISVAARQPLVPPAVPITGPGGARDHEGRGHRKTAALAVLVLLVAALSITVAMLVANTGLPPSPGPKATTSNLAMPPRAAPGNAVEVQVESLPPPDAAASPDARTGATADLARDAAVVATAPGASPLRTSRATSHARPRARAGARPPRTKTRRRRARRPRSRRAAPTKARGGRAWLTVVTRSASGETWADVYLDGASIGRSMLYRRQVPAGNHLVSAKKPGYRPASKKILLKRGQEKRVILELKRNN